MVNPHAVESVSEYNSRNNRELFRKLDEIGFDILPFSLNEYGEVRSCSSTLFLVRATGSPFPSTGGVMSALVVSFAAFASATRAAFAHLLVASDLCFR